MIETIIHAADLHIPNLEDKRPYTQMLKLFAAEVRKLIKDKDPETVRIVLAGDIYHNKIKVTNEANVMFHTLLNYLNAMCKVIIFSGNHDMLENNLDRVDSLSSTFSIANVYENITYLDKALDYKSGFIVDDNIVWVLYSMHDRFRRPDVTAIRAKYPNHRIIGLYHGEISGATTDVGRMMDGGINTDDFKGCDCVMAGHIHRYQSLRKGGVPIVYASSLFQQDGSENVSGHGFVVWTNNKEGLTQTFHEVPNPYRIYRFKLTDYDDVKNNVERLMNL